MFISCSSKLFIKVNIFIPDADKIRQKSTRMHVMGSFKGLIPLYFPALLHARCSSSIPSSTSATFLFAPSFNSDTSGCCGSLHGEPLYLQKIFPLFHLLEFKRSWFIASLCNPAHCRRFPRSKCRDRLATYTKII